MKQWHELDLKQQSGGGMFSDDPSKTISQKNPKRLNKKLRIVVAITCVLVIAVILILTFVINGDYKLSDADNQGEEIATQAMCDDSSWLLRVKREVLMNQSGTNTGAWLEMVETVRAQENYLDSINCVYLMMRYYQYSGLEESANNMAGLYDALINSDQEINDSLKMVENE